jgi:subtilisin family serine protease
MKKSLLIPILTLLLLSGLITPAVAQHKGQAVGSSLAIQMLSQHPKISAPNSVLKGFVNGEPKTRVIINLSKPSNANQLHNLKNMEVRKQLKQAVKEAQNRIVPMLNTKKIRITNKFAYSFGFSAEVSPEELIDLIDHPDILSIEEDAINHVKLKQGIPLMNASTVRNSYNGAGMSIAICDTGIDYTHPRLGGGGFPNTKVIGGWDSGDDDSDPIDRHGHGTACAGIAAGDLGTTGDYIGGVANGAKLYALKVSTGDTDSAWDSDYIEAWEWCITHQNDDPANPIMIISLSFAGGRYFSTCDSSKTALAASVANLVSAGMTLFVASGNEGYCDSLASPACLSQAISVGAVHDSSFGTYGWCLDPDQTCADTEFHEVCDDQNMEIAWDATAADMVISYSNSASFLDLFAPSHNASTTDITGSGGYSSGDYSTNFGGTSAASPYAAGAAACLQSANKAKQGVFLTPDQVRAKLIDYGDLITDGKASIMKPRINLGDSIASITIEDIDTDNDGILNDGDNSGIVGDNPCTGGSIESCDDNCPGTANPDQEDFDEDGVGDVCEQIDEYPGDDYCSDYGPCSEGLGDCDGDSECESGLICVQDVGANYGWDSWVDVCEKAPYPGDDYCSDYGPCSEGLGDCDGDSECESSLICVNDVGADYGWDSWVDVCEN